MPKPKGEPGRSAWMSDAGYKSYLAALPPKRLTPSARKRAEEAQLKAYRKKNPEWAAASDAFDLESERYRSSDAYLAFQASRTPAAKQILEASDAQRRFDEAFLKYAIATGLVKRPATGEPGSVVGPAIKADAAVEEKALARRKGFYVVGST